MSQQLQFHFQTFSQVYAHSITLIAQLITIINIVITAATTLTHLTRLVVVSTYGPLNPMFPPLCNLLRSNSNLIMLPWNNIHIIIAPLKNNSATMILN